jgi:ribosome-interacting GTPase 1
MPTNVPPQYKEAEARYRDAKTAEDKIAALEEMLRIMPKHKGTDKLQADLKARLAKLRRAPDRKGGPKTATHLVPREGAGQVALAGPPNGGKSSLVARLTHAEPRIADYPFTTREPVPGMMAFENVAVQLVDLPPVSLEHVEPWVFDLIRRADLVWLVVRGDAALEGFEETRAILAEKHIDLGPAGVPPPDNPTGVRVYRRALAVVTGADLPGNEEAAAAFRELCDPTWTVLSVSSVDGRGLDDLARTTFAALEMIRVYTKEPGKPPDLDKPFTLPRGATVHDLAVHIHKEIAASFKFARVWGEGVFDGQPVKGDHVLLEGNVVEIHA